MTASIQNFRKLQYAYAGGSTAIMLLYLVLFYGQLIGPGQLLGTSPLNLMIAGVHLTYFVLIRGFINKRSHFAGTAVDALFFSTNIAILILATGGFSSPYFGFWLLILLCSAALGHHVTGIYLGTTAVYLVVAGLLSMEPLSYMAGNSVYLFAAAAAGALGIWLWRNHPVSARNENQMSELSEKLEVEQLKSEILLRSIGDGVIVTDLSGTIQLLNGPACIITGWPQDEATGIKYRNVMPLEDEKGNQLEGEQDPFYKAIISKSSIRRNDVVLLNRDRRKLQLSLVVSPIFSNTGKVSGAIGVFRDISEEKAAARQRDEFISTASHEMRTPVAAIEGFLALALNPKVSSIDENARKYIDKAHESTQHLGQLFRDLLSVTKLEDGRLSNHPKPFDLGKLIKVTIDELAFKAEQKNLDLKLKSSQETGSNDQGVMPLFYINADPERIREVFVNLVDNAIKFTPKGGVDVTINGDNKQVTVGVHDQGIGISKNEINHLFQKFYRIDNTATREIGGTGLGLYLCRQIIELYNGRIWVESEEGKGSSFYFSLPRLTYSQAQEIKKKIANEESGAQSKEAAVGQTVAPTTTN